MKQVRLLLALTFIAALVAVAPATAHQSRQDSKISEASGGLRMSIHTHSEDDPDFTDLLWDTKRLPFDFKRGDTFIYSSRQCELRAPYNDVGLEFDPGYPGIQNPARVRHRVDGTIVRGNAQQGTVRGLITTVLCAPPTPTEAGGGGSETEHEIYTRFRGTYRRVSENVVRITGSFDIVGGQGTFSHLTGGGSLDASLTCLPALRSPSAPSCAQRGHYTDFIGLRGNLIAPAGQHDPGLVGTYEDPSIEPI